MARCCALAVVFASALLLSLPAAATLPDVNQCTWGRCLVVSPKNLTVDPLCVFRFEGTLRNFDGAPVANWPASDVELDFTDCQNPSTRPSDFIPADAPSDANGNIHWEWNLAFGGSDPCAVRVLVTGFLFYVIREHQGLPGPAIDGGVRSPDTNGNGLVALEDLAAFQQQFRTPLADYLGDYDLDGLITLADLSLFRCHFVAP